MREASSASSELDRLSRQAENMEMDNPMALFKMLFADKNATPQTPYSKGLQGFLMSCYIGRYSSWEAWNGGM